MKDPIEGQGKLVRKNVYCHCDCNGCTAEGRSGCASAPDPMSDAVARQIVEGYDQAARCGGRLW